MSRALLRSLRAARPALAVVATLVVAADLRAQQQPAARFAGSAPAAEPRVTAEMALDSVAHYTRAARGARASGAALGMLGGAGVGAAYAGWIGSGRMGMNGGQAAALTAGVAVVAVGWERLRHAHRSEATAREWAARAAETPTVATRR